MRPEAEKGRLYGIGAGPGDPELLTLKAVRAIQKCGVIAVPESEGKEKTAFSIVGQYLEGKELLPCRFVMERDMAKRREARQITARHIIRYLAGGRDVGFITLGDPLTYSTYMYIHELIVREGFAAEIIPGITSYAAAAAALGTALCEDGEALTVIPAGPDGQTDRLLDAPGNKVIMKSGKNLDAVLRLLKERGWGDRTKIACRVTMPGERLYPSIGAYEASPEPGYFTVAIVKTNERPND